MTWRLETVVTTALDSIRDQLEEQGVPYTVVQLGEVAGRGVNDIVGWRDGEFLVRRYPIRQLTTERFTIVETMERDGGENPRWDFLGSVATTKRPDPFWTTEHWYLAEDNEDRNPDLLGSRHDV